MQEQIPDSFKKKFWLAFTKELIKNSSAQIFEQLKEISKQEIVKEEKEKIREEVKVRMTEEGKRIKIKLFPEEKYEFRKRFFAPEQKPLSFEKAVSTGTSRAPQLAIPELRLPLTLQYLRPLPTTKEIDLEKLNSLIKDPLVKIIECNGTDEALIVEGSMGRKMTDIILNKNDIDKIIEKFSQESKIPVSPGIYRVVIGRLTLSAVISNVIGSKFIIKKLAYNPDIVKPVQSENFSPSP